jgi:hypothetical protein
MSRSYRLRHLPQPEGGRSARRFVDGRLRFPADVAEEDFYSHLAHIELKLPCKLKGGEDARNTGWDQTHERCLPRDIRDQLWTLRPGGFWRLGWTRTVTKLAHPLIGYGLAAIPSKSTLMTTACRLGWSRLDKVTSPQPAAFGSTKRAPAVGTW